MTLTVVKTVPKSEQFFDLLYKEEPGFVYVALKEPKSGMWQQEFFDWPSEKESLLDFIQRNHNKQEVYFAPALFSRKEAKKDAVKGSHCFWVEFDGTIPDDTEGIPEPSIKIQSSIDGHEHWYWLLDEFITSIPVIEESNRKLTYTLGSDVSGWDANQVLRPPGTTNHKREKTVICLRLNHSTQLLDFTADLQPAPIKLDEPPPEEIPSVEDVIAKIAVPKNLWNLFRKGVPQGSRSDGLMALGYGFAELKPNLSTEELLSVLLNADNRWGKFSQRTDQLTRLLDIIVKARIKYPVDVELGEIEEVFEFPKFGFTSFTQTEITIDWIWKGWLHKQGYFLLTGPSGVGKSQFALNFAEKAVLQQSFLQEEMERPLRIGFLSLEMGHVELKHFIDLQSQGFTTEELEVLEKNLRLYPVGEPLYLTRDQNKVFVEELIGDEQLDGLIIDSLGSVTSTSLTSEEEVKNLMDWNDRLRKRMNCFTMFIHHHRKASGDNRKPNKLSDVYGSQYITARTTTTLTLWETAKGLTAIPLKIRLRQRPDAFMIERDENLHFTKSEKSIMIVGGDHSPVGDGEGMPEIQKGKFSLGDVGNTKFTI